MKTIALVSNMLLEEQIAVWKHKIKHLMCVAIHVSEKLETLYPFICRVKY